jgi:hypothetical protein
MTQSLCAALLICSMSGPGSSQGAKPNFTGKWSLDAAKSDFGQTPALLRVAKTPQGNFTVTTIYNK